MGAAIHVEVLVRGPGEAVSACVRTAPVTVDGVAERQHRRLRHLVQRRLAENFVERDALELRRAHAADEPDALQAGQRTVVDPDALAVPPHDYYSNSCSNESQASTCLKCHMHRR